MKNRLKVLFCFLSLFVSFPKNSLGSCFVPFTNKPIAEQALVIGSGAFGLSFVQAISGNFKNITVFGRNQKTAYQILKGQPTDVLPGVPLSLNIKPTFKLNSFLKQSSPPEVIVLALPVTQIPLFAKTHSRFFSLMIKKHPELSIVSLSKGFYFKEGKIKFVQDLLVDMWPGFTLNHFYLISGPSFALELAKGEKTLVNLAGHNVEKTEEIKKLLSTPSFNMLVTQDIKGVAFAGAIKNVMAIAGGIGKGLNLSHNSQAALITKGTQELLQIGKELGTSETTFLGPAYLGDLILSLEQESRNSRFGFALGKGQSLNTFLKQNPNVNIEGLNTINSLNSYLKGREGFPFINSLYKIIYENKDPKSLVF